MLPLQDEGKMKEVGPHVLLMSGKELLPNVKKEEVHFFVIGKPKVILTNTNIDDSPEEVIIMFDDFTNIIVDNFPSNILPPIRIITHYIYLIPRSIFPNKSA